MDGRAAPARTFRVCVVAGGSALLGPLAAAARAGLRGSGAEGTTIVASSPAAVTAGLRSCAAGGASLTIAAGFPIENELDGVATAYPRSAFAAIGVDVGTLEHRPANVHGVLFAGQQAGYLAGYAAALWARLVHGRAVGSVGGLDIPPVEEVVAGYEHGAGQAAPAIRATHAWANGFDDAAACRGKALDELGDGAVVELAPAGACGRGIVQAVARKRAFTVSLGALPGVQPPRTVLEVTLRVDVAIESVVAAARAGRLRLGRNSILGAGDGAVGLGPFAGFVPGALRAAVLRRLELLRAGRIPDIPVTVR